MVQAILALRFANRIFCNVWDKDSISAVMITFKEDFGTMGRGGYFDKSGIIRDVMQNHMLQVMTLIAMEAPENSDEDLIKREKAKLVRSIRQVSDEDIVIGQYVGNRDSKDPDERKGYTEDETVPDTSKTPTFATIVFHIDNERWEGVPFIMRAGKAVNEVKDEVRIQFNDISKVLSQQFPGQTMTKNELVIQLKPSERIALRITGKHPGFKMDLENVELDLNYSSKYSEEEMTGPYERLLLSILNDKQVSHFVGRSELKHSWELFTPLLEKVEKRKKTLKYTFGSLGPKEADELCKHYGFHLSEEYPW